MKTVLLAFASAAVLLSQTPPRAEFEVASVKPAGPLVAGQQVNVGVHIDGAQVHCISLAMKDYLKIAYDLKDHQLIGPDWLSSERFDIDAKLPDSSTRSQVREMMQTLLETRFHIKSHRESRDLPVYALTVAKGGIRMKESPLDPEPEAAAAGRGSVNVDVVAGRSGSAVNLGRGSSFSFGDNKFEGRKMTMAGVADNLTRFLDHPVVDMTELSGTYDFSLEFTPEDFRAFMIRSAIAAGVILPPEAMRALEGGSDQSLFRALQTAGLTLTQRKAPVDALIIDHIERTPTEN